jgi:hypothetical protein
MCDNVNACYELSHGSLSCAADVVWLSNHQVQPVENKLPLLVPVQAVCMWKCRQQKQRHDPAVL